MTKEKFFENVEDGLKRNGFLCGYFCDGCPFQVNLRKTRCFFTIDYTCNNGTSYRNFRYKNIMKEYEHYKATLLSEKLK